MPIERSLFGVCRSGGEAQLFSLSAGPFRVALSDYGATLLSFEVPAAAGRKEEMLLGFSSLGELEVSDTYFGATVGRYANRIAGARFELDGKTYKLAANNGPNHLHGGLRGFDRQVWASEAFEKGDQCCMRFRLTSPDGDEGYPGKLDVTVVYSLSPQGRLDIEYEARSDAPTIVALTQHAYFNLHGGGRSNILDHELAIAASRYLPVDSGLIPTGELAPVAGGPFDFRASKAVGRDIDAVGGYDHCFVIDRPEPRPREGEFIPVAELRDPDSGRRLFVSTTFPGLQLYTGNFLEGVKGRGGVSYHKHSALCLETELYPDSPNRREFPSPVLRLGEVWHEHTSYRFEV